MISLPHPIKSRIQSMLCSAPLSFFANRYGGRCSALMYHRIVSESPANGEFAPNLVLDVHVERFEEQIRYLAQNYRCLDIDSAIELLIDGKLPRRSVIITFDDGYRDNLTLALPILERYGVPATIFITTGFIDRLCTPWWYEQEQIFRKLPRLQFEWDGASYDWNLSTLSEKNEAWRELNRLFKRLDLTDQSELMTVIRGACSERCQVEADLLNWSEVVRLHEHRLITIGAHTVNHPALRQLSESDLRTELLDSKHNIERKLGAPVNHLAFPFGRREHATEREFEVASDLGYRSAFTTRAGQIDLEHSQQLRSLPRIAIDFFDTLPTFRWKLSGLSSVVSREEALS